MKQITMFGQKFQLVWQEEMDDDERFTQAWRRLYNCPYPGNHTATHYQELRDESDAYVVRGLLVIHAMEGSYIYEPVKP